MSTIKDICHFCWVMLVISSVLHLSRKEGIAQICGIIGKYRKYA
jgi:hypothetical protein